jgi:anti-anti-sigma regulatory factor
MRRIAFDFLSAGAQGGEHVVYLGTGPLDDVRRSAVEEVGLGDLVAQGVAQIDTLHRLSVDGAVIDPLRHEAFYADATASATVAGFRGVRAFADATAWNRTTEKRRAFARAEYLLDRYIVSHPLTVICADDVSILGEEAVAEVACLHPVIWDSDLVPFRLHASPDGGLALAGEVDALSAQLLETTLDRIGAGESGGELALDASSLGFIDHRSLLALERHAERCSLNAIVLVNASELAAEVCGLLGLRRVRVHVKR